jgi:hypothetical protein
VSPAALDRRPRQPLQPPTGDMPFHGGYGSMGSRARHVP